MRGKGDETRSCNAMGSGRDPMEDGLEIFGGRTCLADCAGGLLMMVVS